MSFRCTLLLLALAASPLALGKNAPQAIELTPSQFAESRADIEREIGKTKRYSELTRSQREEVSRALDRMESALAKAKSVEDLDAATKTQLFNDQELVNNVLTKAFDDSRLICKREKRVGSHRISNTCITVGERRRQRDALERDAAFLQRGDSLLSD